MKKQYIKPETKRYKLNEAIMPLASSNLSVNKEYSRQRQSNINNADHYDLPDENNSVENKWGLQQ